MKTWTLVWFLVFPPNDSGQVEWELHTADTSGETECNLQLAAKDKELEQQVLQNELSGYNIYCNAPKKIPVWRVETP